MTFRTRSSKKRKLKWCVGWDSNPRSDYIKSVVPYLLATNTYKIPHQGKSYGGVNNSRRRSGLEALWSFLASGVHSVFHRHLLHFIRLTYIANNSISYALCAISVGFWTYLHTFAPVSGVYVLLRFLLSRFPLKPHIASASGS